MTRTVGPRASARLPRLIAGLWMAGGAVSAAALMPAAAEKPLSCDLSHYAPSAGLTAGVDQDLLAVSWTGQAGAALRARFGLEDGQPVVHDLAIRRNGGAWATVGEHLRPEYHVVSGVRRLPNDQGGALQRQGIAITQAVIDQNRWYAFWDAPLRVPGTPQASAGRGTPPAASSSAPPTPPGVIPLGRGERVYGLPRRPEEIRHASATFRETACSVRTDGGSLEVRFSGLSMGIFAGDLRFIVYRGTNLIQMDAVARTEEPWVAYKYRCGSARVLYDAHAVGPLARHGRTDSALSVRRSRRVRGVRSQSR